MLVSPLHSRISAAADIKSWARYYETEQPPREMYKLLRMYYLNNGLYDELWDALYAVSAHEQGLRSLRNPAYRAVEFYPAKLWPGALPDALKIQAKNKAIVEPIQNVWQWSNWNAAKQRAARWVALYGDLFIKVAQPTDGSRVFFQLLEPQRVTDFDTDERNYLQYIRIDTPKTRRNGDDTEAYTHTEVWDKGAGTLRIWEHDKDEEADIKSLPDPIVEMGIEEAFKVDFIPIVYAPMRDIGDARGLGAFTQCLDKIDEANRMCTRLHQMLWRHNNVVWALRANATDSSGRPIPAPDIDTDTDGEVTLGDNRLLKLPGNSTLESLVPNLSYGDALAILNAHMKELEQDLPELAYWRLRDLGELSGKAVQLLLSDAIDKLLEARSNAEAALVRADQMALTIGMKFRVFEQSLGDYEDGALDHSFAAREAIPIPERERAETLDLYVRSQVPLATALGRVGWTQDEIAVMEKEKKKEERAKSQSMAATLLQAERMRGQEDEPNNGNGNGDQATSGATESVAERSAGADRQGVAAR